MKILVHINLKFYSRNDLPLAEYNKLEYVIKIDVATAFRRKPFITMAEWFNNASRALTVSPNRVRPVADNFSIN